MIIYRATVFDTPENPFTGGALRAEADAALVVDEGRILERGPFGRVRGRWPEAGVVDLREGLLIPGMVDAHVHFPQVRAIGHLGRPLLEWLDRCALPEEMRLADEGYAREVAAEFVTGLARSGTTTALVFGSHYAAAVDALFAEADRVGLRIASGLVTSDRNLPEPLLTAPERSHEEASRLIQRWHGSGRLRYAVTPRFAYSASAELLESDAALLDEAPGVLVTSHLNENLDEIAAVAGFFPEARDYLDVYARAGLVGRGTVFAHDVHPTDAELALLGETGAAVAHCPTSNAGLGSGIFPLRRHLEHGVRVAMGTDVGAGTGFSMFKEGVQAYFLQRLAPDGVPLAAAHLLHLVTAAGAESLGLGDAVGDLSTGKRFDAVWVRPEPGEPLDVGLRHALSDEDALAKLFALGTPADAARVWVDGREVSRRR
ncbi:guanine deaminase [Gulosibacter sp. 10]|uniref:guanine deaminase n=1 Tax=Gulosibacter sp. 10 TaxID=1255570 RepID=UPI00097F1C36|nr:guanine deaminase [Gulosibacter sp. 10]SJM50198.1 Guanine deaminase [Gulosibacter sp. 10]